MLNARLILYPQLVPYRQQCLNYKKFLRQEERTQNPVKADTATKVSLTSHSSHTYIRIFL